MIQFVSPTVAFFMRVLYYEYKQQNHTYVKAVLKMKNKNWNFLVYVHGGLLLWALLFVVSLFIPDSGKTASVLAIGNALFLFVNIPLAVFSFILRAKDCFSIEYESPVVVLSILNTIIGIVLWIFVVLLAQSPKFG